MGKRCFRLRGDMEIAERWLLGAIHASDGSEAVLDAGILRPGEGSSAGKSTSGARPFRMWCEGG